VEPPAAGLVVDESRRLDWTGPSVMSVVRGLECPVHFAWEVQHNQQGNRRWVVSNLLQKQQVLLPLYFILAKLSFC
jgi:hypothetical protein